MNVEEVLERYKKGRLSKERALHYFKELPFTDMGDIKLDNHRKIRKGFSEVVYCENKSIDQIKRILSSLKKTNLNILLTRINNHKFLNLKKYFKNLRYNKTARAAYIIAEKKYPKKGILILTAGTSDINIAEEAAVTAEVMGNEVEKIFDVGVAGIHRLLGFRKKIHDANVVIVIAGMEGALASVVSGLTDKPIIAVPTSIGYGSTFKGLSALLTMINCCSPGVVVVSIDNGFGAGYFASIINKK